jgi:outer membrane protein assembly factor BamB/tetratricopeptide (TPR) repeat protein
MALQGNLKDFRLGDVLQTIVQARNTGVLRVRSAGQRTVLAVAPTGLQVLEPEILDEDRIVDAFVARGMLAPDRLARARNTVGKGQPVLDVLVNGGTLDADDLRRLVQEAAEEHALSVISWTEGDFRFEESVAPKTGLGHVASAVIEPMGLLLKAAQRADEAQTLADRFGGQVAWLLRVDGLTPPGELTPAAARLLEGLDGKALLADISLRAGIGVFETQKAALALVDAGAARLPTALELAAEAKAREEAGDVRAAVALLRQWHALKPLEPDALTALVDVHARAGRFEDEADALKVLGRILLKVAKPREARDVFDRLVKKRPGDVEPLEGLRQAARAMVDDATYSETTRKLAELALEGGEAAQAANLLQELLTSSPDDLEARVLRAKALARLADREGAVKELERIATLLPLPCRRRQERAAAAWCREALARLAPDRSDLLRRFRAMTDGAPRGRKRALILGGFLLACSGAGFAVWPNPAAGLLVKAREASDRGDAAAALALVAEISERWPDSEEAAAASAIRVKIALASRDANRGPTGAALDELRTRATAVATTFSRWPDPAAVEQAEALADHLKSREGPSAASTVTAIVKVPFAEAVASLRRDAMSRRDALDLAEQAAQRPPASLEHFAEVLARAKTALDPAWVASASRAARAARRLAAVLDPSAMFSALGADVRAVEGDVQAAERAIASRARSLEKGAREYHRALIEDAYERARIDAGPLLVAGDLDRAEACYARLASLLKAVDDDPVLQPLRGSLESRRIPEFARAKTETMSTIREGIRAATEAEKAGNLAGAAAAYASLVKRFDLIAFDRVFTIPLRVESVPPGAHVALNGRDAGTAPAIVRYGWGAQAVLTVSADGYETASLTIRTADPDPQPVLRVPLGPSLDWVKPLVGVVEAPVASVDGDPVLCDRAGRVERRSRTSGEVRWSTDVRSVEGVKGRPAFASGRLWVPLLDGRVVRIDADAGSTETPLVLPGRPVGDVVALGGRLAVATENAVAVFSPGSSDEVRVVPVQGLVTAGAVAAHGAFWVGDSAGRVVRVDAVSYAATTIPTGGGDAILSVAAGDRTVYAVGGDGSLTAVDADVGRGVRWRRTGLADAAGTPAEAAQLVAVGDRAGRVRLFAVADGAPRGERDLRAEARGGLIAVGSRLVAALADGRLWVFDVAGEVQLLDAPLKGAARFGASHLGGGTLAVPAHGASVAVVHLPR